MKAIAYDGFRTLGNHIGFAVQGKDRRVIEVHEDGRFAPESRPQLKIIISIDAGERMIGVGICGVRVARRMPSPFYRELTYAITVNILRGKPVDSGNHFGIFSIEKKLQVLRKLVINPGEGWWTLELAKESTQGKVVDPKVLEALLQNQIAA